MREEGPWLPSLALSSAEWAVLSSSPTLSWNSLASPSLCRAHWQKVFLWGTCLSVDCIVVVSQVRLFLIPYFCDSILVFGRVQMPIFCSDHGREVILKSPFEKYFLSDFVSINAFKNKWSPSLFNFCFIVVTGQRKNADRRTWSLLVRKKKSLLFACLKTKT